jgi:hypothetical protein
MTAPVMDEATVALHSAPCPGCGLEPEVKTYYRRKADKVRCGYLCSCGAIVINGIVEGYGR